MTVRKQLPKHISNAMDDLLKEAGMQFRAGETLKSIDLSMKAWNLMPEPVEQWDFYPQVQSRNMIAKFVELGDHQNAQKWIEIMAEMYDDPNHEDNLVLMTEAEAMYKLGDMNRAYYVFSRVFEIYGRRGFLSERLPYLDFYLKEKAGRHE